MPAETPVLFSVSQMSFRKCPRKSVAMIARILPDVTYSRHFSTVIQRISRQKPQLFNNEEVASLSQAIIVLPTSAHRRYQRERLYDNSKEVSRGCWNPAANGSSGRTPEFAP